MEKDESKKPGGYARAKALGKKETKRIASEAAQARWKLPVAEFPGELIFGDIKLPCAVLSDGSRVLTETDFMAGMGMYRSGALSVRRGQDEQGRAQVPLYLAFKNLEPFVAKHLGDVHIKPIKFRTLSGGTATGGIDAKVIPKICAVWLDARRAGVLGARQEQIADKAEMLLRGLAEVGIIALVDEATGYQKERASDALAKILEAFIAKELKPWVHTFPSEFYQELFRLRGVPYPTHTVKKPRYFGHLTNNIIYARLAPKVLEELKSSTPRDSKGRHKHQLHRRLTRDIGHPKLREHIASAVSLMKISDTYGQFETFLKRAHPKYNETLPLPLGESEPETGI